MGAKGDKEIGAMQAALAALSSLQPDEQSRVLGWLADKLKITPAAHQAAADAAQALGTSPHALTPAGAAPKPKAFLAQKKPSTDVERVTCLAYYLTHYRDTAQFKTRDLTALNKEAAQPKLSNAAFAASNTLNLVIFHQIISTHGE
jgi:hypothetical protein